MNTPDHTHQIVAFYKFVTIEDPHAEVKRHQEFLKEKDVRCRIYISQDGINAQMSASVQAAQDYRNWLEEDARFQNIHFKIDPYHEHVFPRMTVKYRPQLVALDAKPDLAMGGEHLSPMQWKEKLDQRTEQTLLLDVRNGYEWKVGHFEGAVLPELESFRQFPQFAKRLSQEKDLKKTEIMMYCTGGIRCELFSALLKEVGFENVFQLDGGVIAYGQQEGNQHWKGKLFVFDDRLTVPIHPEEESEVISSCSCCGIASDAYYNCANMDCNELFILCKDCGEKRQGCCSEACMGAPRLRPFESSEKPKPFKRWYHYPSHSKQ